jgi:hypothetical protein
MNDSTRKYFMETDGHIPESFAVIDRYNPDALDGIANSRTAIIPSNAG